MHPDPTPREPRRHVPRFGIRALLLVMLVCSVVGAGASYLLQALRGGQRSSQFVFLLFSLAGPVVILLLLSIPTHVRRWIRPRRPPLRSSDRQRRQL